jgi:hypothetical protein
VVLSGRVLTHHGLQAPQLNPATLVLLHLESV